MVGRHSPEQRESAAAVAGPCLVLAPHLLYPIRVGSDILIVRKWGAFSRFVPYVDIVGEREVVRYVDGEPVSSASFENDSRSKRHAALRTILRRSQYLRERFVTAAFAREAQRHLADSSYSTVVASFIYTVPLLEGDPFVGRRRYLVETHNDDFEWYRTLGDASSNPLAKLTARLSERWTAGIVRSSQASDLLLLHVTKTDEAGYRKVAPDHQSLITPIGVTIPEGPPLAQPPNASIRLLFVGSLGVMMNADALAFFGREFHPILNQRLGEELSVDVVGNSPSEAVKRTCAEHGWTLHADASDELLTKLLRRASFTILPFAYATGAKLKLLESIAHGVPFLATSHVMAQLESTPPLCHLGDSDTGWLAHIEAIREKGQSGEERAALVEIAKRHSWEATARTIFEHLTTG